MIVDDTIWISLRLFLSFWPIDIHVLMNTPFFQGRYELLCRLEKHGCYTLKFEYVLTIRLQDIRCILKK